MPVGYIQTVNTLKKRWIKNGLRERSIKYKMDLCGGIQSLSYKNVNAMNKVRYEYHDELVDEFLPFLRTEREQDKKREETPEDLIAAYNALVQEGIIAN